MISTHQVPMRSHVFSYIVFDCLDLEILARLENASVRFVKRDCNVVAHTLVGLALSVGCMSWEGNVPDQIMSSLCKDFLVINESPFLSKK
jgi:hypothetical protein